MASAHWLSANAAVGKKLCFPIIGSPKEYRYGKRRRRFSVILGFSEEEEKKNSSFLFFFNLTLHFSLSLQLENPLPKNTTNNINKTQGA